MEMFPSLLVEGGRMSEKRADSCDGMAGEQDEAPLAKMSRMDVTITNDINGDGKEQGPSATPLPISNPFQERFRAPDLSAGEFHVLDETGNEDEADLPSEDSDSDVDEDELMEMLDADLPAKFKGTRRVQGRADDSQEDDGNYEERDKIVLHERGRHPVEPLPEGWVQVTHMSGIPVYLHRQSRVVTITRPYFLGPGSLRKHDVPLYSIPCLQYLRELQKEAEERGDADPVARCLVRSSLPTCRATLEALPSAEVGNTHNARGVSNVAPCSSTGNSTPTASAAETPIDSSAVESITADSTDHSPVEAETAGKILADVAAQSPVDSGSTKLNPDEPDAQQPAESGAGDQEASQAAERDISDPTRIVGTSVVVKDPSLTPQEVNEYCLKRFQFKTIRLMKFNTWRERRQFLRKKRTQRPQMSSKTKLLSFPVQPSRNSATVPGTRLREWVLNPGGKSYVCILHEYLQHVLREQPVYSYSELENAATPYGATVSVQSVKYGSGYGSSKKQAKSEAAKATLQIFIPNLMEQIDGDKTVKGSAKPADMDLSFFDSIRLEDPRVADLCSKAAEPSPYTILLICLQRNFGLTSNQVTCKLHTNKHQHNEFEMTVGKHTARVSCKNKKDGKHLAAQSVLQQLHPHVTSWGSLLRMYGNHSSKSLKVKRQEEQQITLLQSKATVNSPNYAILDKLREEMRKLQEVRRQIQPIGILQLSEVNTAEPGPSESGVTLDVVDL